MPELMSKEDISLPSLSVEERTGKWATVRAKSAALLISVPQEIVITVPLHRFTSRIPRQVLSASVPIGDLPLRIDKINSFDDGI
jgi:hypothetical protein